MPIPNAKAIKAQIDAHVEGSPDPRQSIEDVIRMSGWSPIDVILAYVDPKLIDDVSAPTDDEAAMFEQHRADSAVDAVDEKKKK